MTTNIQLLRSSVAFKRPSAAPLLDGQAAVNYNAAEPGLFFRLTDGSLTKVGPVAMTVDGSRPNSAPAGQTGNSIGEQWLNASPILFKPVQYVHNGSEFVPSSGFAVDEASGAFSLERTLFAQRLETNGLEVLGNAVIGGNITPNGQNCAYFLGGPAERWDFGYMCNLDVSGTVTIGDNLNPDCTNVFTINASTQHNCDVTFSGGVDFPGVTDWVLGQGCGAGGSVTIDAPFTVNCDATFLGAVNFLAPNLTLGQGCGTSTVTIDANAFFNCDILPFGDNVVNLGSAANRFANIFTGDLHLKNDRGDWTMIEEEDYLSLKNNKTGKTFRLLMEEV